MKKSRYKILIVYNDNGKFLVESNKALLLDDWVSSIDKYLKHTSESSIKEAKMYRYPVKHSKVVNLLDPRYDIDNKDRVSIYDRVLAVNDIDFDKEEDE